MEDFTQKITKQQGNCVQKGESQFGRNSAPAYIYASVSPISFCNRGSGGVSREWVLAVYLLYGFWRCILGMGVSGRDDSAFTPATFNAQAADLVGVTFGCLWLALGVSWTLPLGSPGDRPGASCMLPEDLLGVSWVLLPPDALRKFFYIMPPPRSPLDDFSSMIAPP